MCLFGTGIHFLGSHLKKLQDSACLMSRCSLTTIFFVAQRKWHVARICKFPSFFKFCLKSMCSFGTGIRFPDSHLKKLQDSARLMSRSPLTSIFFIPKESDTWPGFAIFRIFSFFFEIQAFIWKYESHVARYLKRNQTRSFLGLASMTLRVPGRKPGWRFTARMSLQNKLKRTQK